MKIIKKSKVNPAPTVKKALDADTSAVLTEDEILTLKDALPKLVALLNGEAEIEILDDTEDAEEIEDIEAESEITPIDDIVEDDVEEKAEDNAETFNADDVLNDPAKRAAIEEALKKKAGDQNPAEKPKAQDQAPVVKKIFKKVVNQKAGDSVEEKPVKKSPNAALVGETPVKKATDKALEPTVKKFDFHKNNK